MTFILRDYQAAAVDSVFNYWNNGGPGNPLIDMATGSGKSPVAGELARRLVQDFDAPVVIATHRKELIAQDYKAVRQIWPDAPVSIFSAGLSSKRIDRITIAGIQSVWKKAELFQSTKVVIIDECHLISIDDDTMYKTFLDGIRHHNPDLRLIGLTATPYRVGQGLLTHGEGAMFDTITYRTDILQLLKDGYLAPLVSPAKKQVQIDTSQARTQAGDWVAKDLELASDLPAVNDAVAKDVAAAIFSGRTSALVFTTGVGHASHLAEAIRLQGVNAKVVVGDTPDRDKILADFKVRGLQCLVSCDVVTTGYDAPCVDAIFDVRPTKSPGLHVQKLGRGMRVCEGKKDCIVYDYGGNIARHGPITDVKPPNPPKGGTGPTKTCPKCLASIPVMCLKCIHCDTEFEPIKKAPKTANENASELNPMISDDAPRPVTRDVMSVECFLHVSKTTGRRMMRCNFRDEAWQSIASEYVCLEHDGYALQKAHVWWRAFFVSAIPSTIEEAVESFTSGHMRAVKSVTCIRDGKFFKVKSVEFVPGMLYDPESGERIPNEREEPAKTNDQAPPTDDFGDIPF
jgi:DNA repair protein RadD